MSDGNKKIKDRETAGRKSLFAPNRLERPVRLNDNRLTGASQPPRQVGSPMQALLAQALGAGAMDSSLGPVVFTAIFLASTFAAALVAGLGGFAFGLVAAAAWLYIL